MSDATKRIAAEVAVQEASLAPKTAWQSRMAQWDAMIKTGLLPSQIKTPQQAEVIARTGEEMGMGPMRAFKALIVIKGKASLGAEGVMGLIRERCPNLKFLKQEATKDGATIVFKRGDDDDVTVTYTAEEAKAAGLMRGDTWAKYPADMLWARCVTRMGRRHFADITQGASYTAEEIEGPQDVTVTQVTDDDLEGL